MRLEERVTVVTGAASGIGRALCPLLGSNSARLILIDQDRAALASLAGELTAAGTGCATATVDVCDRRGLREAIQSRVCDLGPVDLLIACAGTGGATLVDQFDVERLAEIARVNFLGAVNTIDAVLPEMLQRRRGQIVAISSLMSYRGLPFGAAYSASKAALSRYLESLRPPLRPLIMVPPRFAARRIVRAILRRRQAPAASSRPGFRRIHGQGGTPLDERKVLALQRYVDGKWV